MVRTCQEANSSFNQHLLQETDGSIDSHNIHLPVHGNLNILLNILY